MRGVYQEDVRVQAARSPHRAVSENILIRTVAVVIDHRAKECLRLMRKIALALSRAGDNP